MSVRLLGTRLLKHGRFFLQNFWKREIHINISEQNPLRVRNRYAVSSSNVGFRGSKQPISQVKNVLRTSNSTPASGLFRFGHHARKLFIDNILNRVTNNFSDDLRKQATKKLFYGDSGPFFALVGVSLATGTGMLTKEDELEGVCWEIREAASRLQAVWTHNEVPDALNSNFNIDKLDIGPPIAKGCAAVVYAAALKDKQNTISALNDYDSDDHDSANFQSVQLQDNNQPMSSGMITPIQNISRFVHNFGGSVDNLYNYNQIREAAENANKFQKVQRKSEECEKKTIESDFESTSNSNISSLRYELEHLNTSNADINRYPLALKMMFNYDIQSNALCILRAMYKETVPARQRYAAEYAGQWERLLKNQTLSIPPHPNIVYMLGFFCDEVRSFPDGHILYPIAQPQRINPNGYGRNMSLYLLMKRYDYSLRALLDNRELNIRTKLLLFTQLLEAVTHINFCGIAHRDLKSDNILIEMNDDKSAPVLVLSDFGCCLADKEHQLQIPYNSYDIDKGGNAALMAPEIINKQPGPFATLNYGKSDLWACGAIAYEIFGNENPFYFSNNQHNSKHELRNSDYDASELPSVSDDCPLLVQKLIFNILDPNPSKRVSPDVAANVMQLFLWAPSNWLKSGGMPNSPEILQWLLSLSTKLITDNQSQESGVMYNRNGRRTYTEYLLICSFLARAELRRIRGALNWIQNVV